MRPAKLFGNFFVLIVLTIMGFIYYTHEFIVWGPRAEGKLPVSIFICKPL